MTLTPVIEIGFGATWRDEPSTITWTDVSGYVLDAAGVQVNRGRSSVTDTFNAGQLSLTVDNADRRFDPSHTTGPYYGDLLPGVPLRVTVEVGGRSVPRFFGYVEGWPQSQTVASMPTVQILATDGFSMMARLALPATFLEAELLADDPIALYRLDESAGRVMVDSSGNGNDGTYTAGATANSASFVVNGVTYQGIQWSGTDYWGEAPPSILPGSLDQWTISAVASMPDGLTGSDPGNIIGQAVTRFYDPTVAVVGTQIDKVSLALDPASATTAAVDAAADGGFECGTHDFSDGKHLSLRVGGTGLAVFVDGVDTASTGSGDYADPGSDRMTRIGGFGAGSKLITALVAIFDGALTDARLQAHGEAFALAGEGETTGERIERILDYIDWPVELRNIDTGASTLGPSQLGGTALDHLRLVEASEDGRLFIDADGSVTFLDRYHAITSTRGGTSQATIDDDDDVPFSAVTSAFDRALMANRVTVSRAGGASVSVSDAASIATYGEYALDLSTLVASEFESRSLAEWRRNRSSTPVQRVPAVTVLTHCGESFFANEALDPADSLLLESGDVLVTEASDALVTEGTAHVFDLRIGDRVTIEQTPLGVGSASSFPSIIEGISEQIQTTTGEWVTTFYLSTAGVDEAMWVLDTSTFDDDTVLVY